MNPEENQGGSSAQDNSQGQQNMHKDPVMDFTKGNNNNTIMGILSYLGPFVVVPYLMAKDNDFVRFHVKQGLVLFGIAVLVMILGNMMNLWMLGSLLNLAVLILSIIGIVNVIQGNRKELPVVGGLATSLNI